MSSLASKCSYKRSQRQGALSMRHVVFRRVVSRLAGILALAAMALPALAQPSTSTVTYQGVLTQNGSPVADGTYALTFKIYDAATAGNVVETISVPGVQTTQGRFTALVPVTPSSFNGSDRWWTVTHQGVEMLPRQKVTAVPYAVRAATAIEGGDSNGVFRLAGGDSRIEVNQPLDSGPQGRFGGLLNGSSFPWLRTHTRFQSGNNGDYVARLEFSDLGLGDSGVQIVTKNGGDNFHLLRCYYRGLNRFIVDESGNGFFGGNVTCSVLTIRGADLAEKFDIATLAPAITRAKPLPGLVVSINPAHPGKLMVSTAAYDKKVAGVISGANGLSVGAVLGQGNPDPLINGEHPVAMTGRVWVYADEPPAKAGEASTKIAPGDRLTTSATKPGHAMKVLDESRAPGSVIGKAMTPRDEQTGMVLVLVNLQ